MKEYIRTKHNPIRLRGELLQFLKDNCNGMDKAMTRTAIGNEFSLKERSVSIYVSQLIKKKRNVYRITNNILESGKKKCVQGIYYSEDPKHIKPANMQKNKAIGTEQKTLDAMKKLKKNKWKIPSADGYGYDELYLVIAHYIYKNAQGREKMIDGKLLHEKVKGIVDFEMRNVKEYKFICQTEFKQAIRYARRLGYPICSLRNYKYIRDGMLKKGGYFWAQNKQDIIDCVEEIKEHYKSFCKVYMVKREDASEIKPGYGKLIENMDNPAHESGPVC